MINFFEAYVKSLCSKVGSDDDVRFVWEDGAQVWSFREMQQDLTGDGFLPAEEVERLMLAIPAPIMTALQMHLTWIAGGFVRRWLAGEDMYASDIDLFFSSAEAKQETIELLLAGGFQIIFQCPEGKLTSLKREYEDGARPTLVQCISQDYYAGPLECIDTFDFTVSMFAIDVDNLFMGLRSLRDLSTKVLVLHSLPFPAATMRRLIKYAVDGYRFIEDTAIDFLTAVRTDALGRFLESGAQDAFASVGGSFEDDRPAGVREDFNRWYID